jgi:hypothetical protein
VHTEHATFLLSSVQYLLLLPSPSLLLLSCVVALSLLWLVYLLCCPCPEIAMNHDRGVLPAPTHMRLCRRDWIGFTKYAMNAWRASSICMVQGTCNAGAGFWFLSVRETPGLVFTHYRSCNCPVLCSASIMCKLCSICAVRDNAYRQIIGRRTIWELRIRRPCPGNKRRSRRSLVF